MKIKKHQIIGIILFIVLLSLIYSLDLSSVSVTPTNATTISNLSCTWTVSGESQVNVSWYNNSVLFNTTINATSPFTLSNVYTKRGDVWNCTIIAENSTASTVSSSSVTISNAPPLTPYLANTSDDDVGDYEEIIEGVNTTFFLTSSDDDGDTLVYAEILNSGNDYCTINTGNGTVTCYPTAEPDNTTNDQYQFLVNDGINIVGLIMDFNVTPVNDAPTFSVDLSNISIIEGQKLAYNVTVNDEENTTGPFTFIANETGESRLVNVTSDNKNFVITFFNNRSSNFSDIGNFTVNVTACDPENTSLCVSDDFNLEIITVNHAPTLVNLTNKSGVQNQNFFLYVNATDVDTEDVLSFSVSSLDCGIDIWTIDTLINTSTNASGLINVTLNNTHIQCANITVTVSDTKVTTSENLYLNLSNVNDAPILYNYSYYNGNTNGNTDIRNITSYTGMSFLYKVNGTDVDLLVDSNESLNYTDNSSNCNGNCPTLTINSSTGIITFMPNSSLTGNYYYLINVSDNYGESVTAIFNITINNNSAPYYNQSLTNQTAYEDILFTYQVNATDPDQDDSIDKYSDNSALFDISQTGLINFTPNCSQTGSYTINITVNDTFGAENETSFNLEVVMVAEAPVFSAMENLTAIEGAAFYWDVEDYATDGDITCGQTDTLRYTSRFIYGSTLFNVTLGGEVFYTPNSTTAGSYLINFTVLDDYNKNTSTIWNLTILNRTLSPQIINITPHGKPMNTTWVTTSSLGINFTNTNTTENTTVYFDHNSTDPDGDSLIFNWTLNSSGCGTERNYSRFFGFSESGVYNLTLKVSDNVSGFSANEATFTWNLTIENLNRLPYLNNSLPNVTNLSSSYRWNNYLSGGAGNYRFVDPDGDTLTYNNTNVTKLTITYDGNDVIFTPLENGIQNVTFTASDGYGSPATSNIVTINVTLENETTEDTGATTSSSSSSSSRVVTVSIVEEVEIDKQIYLDIINPEPAVIYNNNTLRQELNIVNTGNETLRGIRLSAYANSTTADLTFSNDFIAELQIGETQKTDLVVVDYKLFSNYEIIVSANVTDPDYFDKAVIYVNALERTKGNQSVANTKITFARDLLQSNPECLELNEFLKKARNYMDLQDYEEAAKIIDEVIQGCKYLVSQSKLKDDSPTGWLVNIDFDKVPYLKPVLLVTIITIIAIVIMTVKIKKSNEENE